MIWPSKDLGILECGCEVNHAMRISKTCPAHRGDGRIELQRFSLDQAANIRCLEQNLRSVRSQLQKAQVVRHRANLKARTDLKNPPTDH